MQKYLSNNILQRFINLPAGAGGGRAALGHFFFALTYIKIVINFNGIKSQFQAETIFAKYPKQIKRIFKQAGRQQTIYDLALRNEMDNYYLSSYPILLPESLDENVKARSDTSERTADFK